MSLESDLDAIVKLIRSDVTIGTKSDDGIDAWKNDEQEVTYALLGYRRQGVDERRTALEGEDIRERIYGNRTLRIQFTVNTNKQTFENTALEIADDLIAGFNRTDVEDVLAAHELGVPVCTDPREITLVDAHKDGRSVAVFEAAFPASRRTGGPLITRIKRVVSAGNAGGHEIDTDVST